MFRNYLVTARRNIARHKLYSFINIAGLAVGLACVIFIMLFVRDELSYDKWIPVTQNLYRVESTFSMPGEDDNFVTLTPFPVTPTMQADFPEVVAQTHIIPETMTAQIGDHNFPVTVDSVDPNFLQVIQLPMVVGNPATALAKPESILLSQTTAKKFFGAANPIGKTVILGGTHSVVVTGILRDLPHNTHLVADLVMPNTSQADTESPRARAFWLGVKGWGYIKLAPGTDPALLAGKLGPMLDKNIDVKKRMGLNMRGSQILHLHITPFREIHLAQYGTSEKGHWARVYGFASIAELILLIACFNYMNLATAGAIVRAREISLRKVMGARRSQLIVQFLGESVVTALVALVLAFVLVEILLPSFDSLLARPIAYNEVTDWPLTLAIVVVALATGLLGGVYPALLLSRFRPADRLGTGMAGAGDAGLLRATLVVLQFAISIGLGISVIVMFAQIRYARHADLGFDRHNLVVIGSAGPLTPAALNSVRQTLAAEPSIAGAALSGMVPFDGQKLDGPFSVPGRPEQFVVRIGIIDPDFIGVYRMKLLAGRNLARDIALDEAPEPDPKNRAANANRAENILISAVAARQFGFTPQRAIGQHLISKGQPRMNIVGVVGDTNYDGLETAVPPFIFLYDPWDSFSINVRIKPGQTQAALAAIDRIWHRFVPTVAIQRHFENDSFDRLFNDDERESAIFALFVGIAISIACLGLLGLTSFATERRTKEIGMRKMFGARTRDVTLLLLWQFSTPVLVANAIAWPIAWYYLHGWLQGFAYRIALSPIYFAGAGLAALLIAWATIFAHALRVARANPVHALRTE